MPLIGGWYRPGKRRIALICSCPSRLGDDMTIMEQVEEAASEFDNIECCWSRAGNLADKIFEAGVATGGRVIQTPLSIYHQ